MAARLRGAKGARLAGFIAPCLATSQDSTPSGDPWLHEIKFDGYRLQLRKADSDVRLLTRRGYDWTKKFPSLVDAAWYLPASHLILDGEVIVPTKEGHSDFGALEADLGAGRSDRFVYFAFDILHINSTALGDCALIDRKSVLVELLQGQTRAIKFSEHLTGDGAALFRRACKLELEGLVSKRKAARYHSGRSTDWFKRTCRQRETFVVAGVAFREGKFNGLYLARRQDGQLNYAGKVENGFDEATETKLRRKAETLR
jgi:bifunctional non-homologous end joining protein LigD